MKFSITNEQRRYFGLDPIESHWESVILEPSNYQPESVLYFEGDLLKKQIICQQQLYYEWTPNLLTKERTIIIPKTSRGKEKKLTAATLEKYKPVGMSLKWHGILDIVNHDSQISYYSSYYEESQLKSLSELERWIDEFIQDSRANHLEEIELFKTTKRKNVKYKEGDFFAFKLGRFKYGFGRIILDIHKLRKSKSIDDNHGLQYLMGAPVLVKIYAFTSSHLNIDIESLHSKPSLPSDYMMDNLLFYGEYPIIGSKPLRKEEYDFPISYGVSIDFTRPGLFLQWGLIHLELPRSHFNKFLSTNSSSFNPYSYLSIGSTHRYGLNDIEETITNGKYRFTGKSYKLDKDLRNPVNEDIRREILEIFGLDPKKSYFENCDQIGVRPLA